MKYLKRFYIFISFAFILLILFSANFELIKAYREKPPNTKYFGAIGYYFDYYQFLSWIRDGKGGKILVSSKYIPREEPPVLLHPFFPALGFVGGMFNLSPAIIYHLFRNIFLIVWLATLYLLAKTVFSSSKTRQVAYLFLLVATGFPQIILKGGSITLQPLIPFWTTFYTLEKFNYPPHHLAADILFVLLIILILRLFAGPAAKVSRPSLQTRFCIQRSNRVELGSGCPLSRHPLINQYLIMVAIISLLLVLLNPATTAFLLAILSTLLIYLFIASRFNKDEREFFRIYLRLFLVIIISTLPVFLYNFNIFQNGNPWKYYYLGEKVGRYDVSFITYIFSLGPLFLTGLLSFFYISRFRLGEKILGIWLILPPLMFPYVGRLLPFSMSRLFALNVYIPAALLTAYFLEQIISTNASQTGDASGGPPTSAQDIGSEHLVGVTSGRTRLLLVFLVVSLSLGFIFSIKDVFELKFANYYNVFLPNDLNAAIEYIKIHTRPNSTVLAGGNISNLIPAFTNNHVVLGREDAYPSYQEMKDKVSQIYFRTIEDGQILERLRGWRVQYIIFGIDNIGYNEFIKKGKIAGIEEVFNAGSIIVAEVL